MVLIKIEFLYFSFTIIIHSRHVLIHTKDRHKYHVISLSTVFGFSIIVLESADKFSAKSMTASRWNVAQASKIHASTCTLKSQNQCFTFVCVTLSLIKSYPVAPEDSSKYNQKTIHV